MVKFQIKSELRYNFLKEQDLSCYVQWMRTGKAGDGWGAPPAFQPGGRDSVLAKILENGNIPLNNVLAAELPLHSLG